MVVVPAATAVTKPVVLTVATLVLEETHGLEEAGLPEPVNCKVLPILICLAPVMVGKAVIEMDFETE